MKNVFVVGGDLAYHNPFERWGKPVSDENILKTPDKISFVLFTGGSDVSPALYNENKNYKTYDSPSRDEYEFKIYKIVKSLDLPMVGVCRGAQFLCAMAGGTLVQHMTGHHNSHLIITDDNREIEVSSSHHQMQLPPDDAEIIAWSKDKLSSGYEGPTGVKLDVDKEYDVVYYPSIKALGMQYHPERQYMKPDSEGALYAQELVERFIGQPEN